MENNQKNEISLGATLYDMNKQVMQQQKVLSNKEIEEAKKELETWFNWYLDGYAMLLCRERYDFTVFLTKDSMPEIPPILTKSFAQVKESFSLFKIE